MFCDDWIELHGDRNGGDDMALIGGIGSIKGALIGCILVGLTDTLGGIFLPKLFGLFMDLATATNVGSSIASMSIYILMSIVLVWRPTGLFGQKV